MEVKLKENNGEVKFLLKSGKDFVANTTTVSAAEILIREGKVTKSDNPEFPICVDNTWFFEGELTEEDVMPKHLCKAKKKGE